ncbi:unnamed protein product [Urochloa humidicola]
MVGPNGKKSTSRRPHRHRGEEVRMEVDASPSDPALLADVAWGPHARTRRGKGAKEEGGQLSLPAKRKELAPAPLTRVGTAAVASFAWTRRLRSSQLARRGSSTAAGAAVLSAQAGGGRGRTEEGGRRPRSDRGDHLGTPLR